MLTAVVHSPKTPAIRLFVHFPDAALAPPGFDAWAAQAASAISESGRIQATILPIAARDEIGDLSRTLTTMLNQLKIQTEYREKMADNLEHEMRTPLAGISASLKNMAREMDDAAP